MQWPPKQGSTLLSARPCARHLPTYGLGARGEKPKDLASSLSSRSLLCFATVPYFVKPLRAILTRKAASKVSFPEDMHKPYPVRAAYVHIPFCRQRCRYCDFPIDVVGKTLERPKVWRYLTCLKTEILRGGSGTFEDFDKEPLRSLYFGGGTPSLLPASQLSELLTLLHERFGFRAGCEITMEMDPGTFSEETASELASCGVVRASVGIQSLDDEILRRCGRGHTALEATQALRTLRAVGFQNISADILSGVPGQTKEQLTSELRQLSELGVDHLSVYDLQYEPGTDFARRFPDPGMSGRPTEDVAAELYETAHQELEALGFEHYEISNYARLRGQRLSCRRSRHNQTYWQRQPYAAFGNGAASFVAGVRATRPRKLDEYCDFIENAAPMSSLEVDTSQRDSLQDALFEAVMLGLRTLEGIDITATGVASPYLFAVARALQPWQDSGDVRMDFTGTDASSSFCNLTAALLPPGGFLVSDAVLSDALAAVMSVAEGESENKHVINVSSFLWSSRIPAPNPVTPFGRPAHLPSKSCQENSNAWVLWRSMTLPAANT